jgi:hypothetical protein
MEASPVEPAVPGGVDASSPPQPARFIAHPATTIDTPAQRFRWFIEPSCPKAKPPPSQRRKGGVLRFGWARRKLEHVAFNLRFLDCDALSNEARRRRIDASATPSSRRCRYARHQAMVARVRSMRFAVVLLCLWAFDAGCTALLDTASLQGGTGGEPTDASHSDHAADASAELQCPTDAGALASCIARSCCSYISTCRADTTCSPALTAYDACIALAKTDAIKRMACAAAFRSAADGKAADVVNCDNLYRDVCNDV